MGSRRGGSGRKGLRDTSSLIPLVGNAACKYLPPPVGGPNVYHHVWEQTQGLNTCWGLKQGHLGSFGQIHKH